MSDLTGFGSSINEFLGFGGVGELAGVASATQMPDIDCKGVIFKAQWANTGYVYLGKSTVTVRNGATDTTTGLQLAAGEMTPYLPCLNLSDFYRICDGTGDCLTYIYFT